MSSPDLIYRMRDQADDWFLSRDPILRKQSGLLYEAVTALCNAEVDVIHLKAKLESNAFLRERDEI